MACFEKARFALLAAAVLSTVAPSELIAQQQNQQPEQPVQPVPVQHVPKRYLWIARFTADPRAAAAVASTQASDTRALKYSNLFDGVKTFETDASAVGSWTLTARELDFNAGSAAARALVGMGAGRARMTMEYTLTDPNGKAAWTQKITTRPSFWRASGPMGAVQNQKEALDEQGQKLAEAIYKFFDTAGNTH